MTGDSPLDAFGPAEAYASTRFRPLAIRWVVGSLVSSVLFGVGITALVVGAMPRTGPSGEVVVTVDDVRQTAVLGAGWFLVPWLSYAVERVVVARLLAAGRVRVTGVRVAVGVVVFAVLLAAILWLDLPPADEVVAEMPRWLLLLLAGGVVPAFVWGRPGDRPVTGPVAPRGRAGTVRERVVDWLLGRTR